ncbi:OB-fold nucleic acid binding domain-containing protein, partial [[Eubacterium] cellulosolvens]
MEDLIARILAQRKDLTREKIETLIEEKKREAQDLLSDQGAARLVAEELLVETEPVAVPSMTVRNLVAGLNDVTLNGKVVAIEPVKEFLRQDGSTGRVLKIVLSDETGMIGCAIWDEKADLIVKHGDLTGKSVTVGHGYTRAGLTGDVELNIGERGNVTISPELEPPEPATITSIGDIKEPVLELNVLGIIHSKPRLYEFERNGQKGAVLRTVLADSTGSVSLAAWNEKAEELRNLKRGDILRVQGGRLRRDNSGRLEIHVENRTKATVLEQPPEGFEVPEIKAHKISELKANLPTANLLASVVGVSDPQTVQRKTGESVAVSRMLLGDETGLVNVSLWDDKAELASKLKAGDIVRIEDAKPNLRLGQISLSVGRTSSLERVEGTGEPIKVKISKIHEAGSSSELVAIEGELIGEPETRDVTTGKGENIKVTSTRIRDDTGEVRVSFWRSHAAEAGKLRAGARIRAFGLLPRPGLAGETEFNSVQASKLEVLPQARGERPSSDEIRQFITLKENEQAWVRAIVLDAGEDAALTSVCDQCEEPTVPSNGKFACPTHGTQAEAAWVLTTRMRLDDGTDIIVANVRTKDPHSLLGKSLSWAQKEILAKKTSTVALPIDATGKLAGMRIEAFGVTRRDPQTGKL